MHLLYARFFTKFTRDAGMNKVGEPFGRLVCQGMLNAPAPYSPIAILSTMSTTSNCLSDLRKRTFQQISKNEQISETPLAQEMISRFGADTVRLFILFSANPEAGMDWSDSASQANHRKSTLFSTP